MAVHATARVSTHGDVGISAYAPTVTYDVRDGSNSHYGSSVVVSIPHGTDSAKANRSLREAVAADILSQFSLTIDPGDIYCPSLL